VADHFDCLEVDLIVVGLCFPSTLAACAGFPSSAFLSLVCLFGLGANSKTVPWASVPRAAMTHLFPGAVFSLELPDSAIPPTPLLYPRCHHSATLHFLDVGILWTWMLESAAWRKKSRFSWMFLEHQNFLKYNLHEILVPGCLVLDLSENRYYILTPQTYQQIRRAVVTETHLYDEGSRG